MSDKEKGLYDKFKVERTDGRSAPDEKHHGCEYFVLDLTHDPYAASALAAYANACRREYRQLARDLDHKVFELQDRQAFGPSMAEKKRRELGLTCRELGERAGMRPSQISEFEHGRHVLTLEEGKRLRAALEI